jgi:NAD(P)-dependent dehydrogenase (short-subunit alcohol dehydrogenase family)
MSQKVAVVTGANRGIGKETAIQLAEKGYHVYMGVRNTEAAEEIVKAHPDLKLEAFKLDVTNRPSIQNLYGHIEEKFDRIDVLVNNAAIYIDEDVRFKELGFDDFDKTMKTNLYGPFYMIRTFLPLMEINQYGRIVNISSGYGSMDSMNNKIGSYKISKLGLNGLTRIFADEVDGKEIKINAVCPGWVKTDMGGPGATRLPEEAAKWIVWACELPEDGPNGGFFRDGEAIEW